MADQDHAALAPCPFCGGIPYGEASVYDYTIVCRPCSLKMRRNSEHRANVEAAWNRRVPDPAVLALTEERDRLRAALTDLYETRSAAADIEDGMNVIRCTDAEWDAHVAACRKAHAALRGKEGT